jgi:ABC-type transport system involved in multi-copper enzyme maturation permease subunit
MKSLAVARYTIVEMSRRRLLIVFFAIGAVGIAGLGILLKAFSSAFVGNVRVSGPGDFEGPTPEQLTRLTELSFVNDLIAVLGIFALLIAFAIGMTAIYHDLESGSIVGIFSKPVSRLEFAVGKVVAAAVGMIVVVGLLGVEARLVMYLFGGGLEDALWWETLAAVANAVTLMLIVLALSAWVNNIVAAIIAFIYNGAAGIVVMLHQQMTNGGVLADNQVLHVGLTILYWLVPHALISSAPREIAHQELEILNSTAPGGANFDQAFSGIPGPSGAADIIWWAFVVAVLFGLVYLAVRRRQV